MSPVADAQHRPGGGLWARGAQGINELRRATAAARRVRGERHERVERGDGAHGGDPLRVALVEARKDGARNVVGGGIALRLGVNELVEQRFHALSRVRHKALLPAAQLETRWHIHVVGRFDSIAFGGNLHIAQPLRSKLGALLNQIVIEFSLDLFHTCDRLVVFSTESSRWKNLKINLSLLAQESFLQSGIHVLISFKEYKVLLIQVHVLCIY